MDKDTFELYSQEEEMIVQADAKLGKTATEIAKRLKDRTPASVANWASRNGIILRDGRLDGKPTLPASGRGYFRILAKNMPAARRAMDRAVEKGAKSINAFINMAVVAYGQEPDA